MYEVGEKLKEHKVNVSKIVAPAIAVTSAVAVMAVPALAETSAVETAMTTAATSIASEVTGIVTSIIPIGAGVLALFVAAKQGIKAIKMFMKS